ncbi:MAG TPA: PASTA domain-containing protein [Acidimicrobiia bacterium]|nr:PASTA domain-containing protein [Acidimicrobiia bacterium]
MPSSAVADLVGRVLASRYRLLAPIGAGASGRVYVADDVRLRRRVAVKALQAGLGDDAGFIRRFQAEAQLAASLHHPNVLAVYDWGQDEGLAFMVVELLRGGSLRALLDTRARLSPAQATRVGRQVAEGLRYAHGRGLVHRDIKPANLLFDEHGVVRVADFGLARALAEASWTEPFGALVGTARYAAPEQASAVPVDARADLYALAVVLVESCTGEVPVVGDTTVGTLAARHTRGIVAPPELGALGAVIERAGRPDRAERYPDAATMVAALSDVAARLPAPEPLPLAGLGDEAEDADPTRLGVTRADGATRSGETTAKEDAAPLAIAVRPAPFRARRAVPYVVGAAIVAALVAALLLLVTGGPGPSVAAPTLVGESAAQARASAANAGFLVQVVQQRRADDPTGLVIAQDPAPGAFVAKGGTLDVVVSRGPPPVPVPNVASRPANEAQYLLAQAGFVVALDHRYDETVPRGSVIGTSPAGGARAAPESTVRIVVSDGPAPIPIPNVANESAAAAAQALSASGFSPVAQNAYSDTVPVGQVIDTNPPAGSSALRGTTVTLHVSQGPQPVVVPDLRGQAVEAASAQLTALGLVPDVQNYGPGKPVQAMSPAPGTTVKKGSSVTLVL